MFFLLTFRETLVRGEGGSPQLKVSVTGVIEPFTNDPFFNGLSWFWYTHTHVIWVWCFLRAYIIDETPKPKDTVEGGKVIEGDGHQDGEASEADPVEPKEWVPCPPVCSFWSHNFFGRELKTCPNIWQLHWHFCLHINPFRLRVLNFCSHLSVDIQLFHLLLYKLWHLICPTSD